MTGPVSEEIANAILLLLEIEKAVVEVELTIETSGCAHIEAIKRHLHDAGYAVEEVLQRKQALEGHRKRAAKAAPSLASHSVTEVWP